MIALDASALLAFLLREPGHERVAERLSEACVSTVNLAEALGRFAQADQDAAAIGERLLASPLEFVDFTRSHAVIAAALLPATRRRGLALGDRACLALARARGIAAWTADRAWRGLDLGIEIVLIR